MADATIVLSTDEINNLVSQKIPGWIYNDEKKCLQRLVEFKGYYKTISFVNTLAFYANKKVHHPDLHVTYKTCLVEFTTHDSGGVTQKDIEMAEIVNDILS
ncbi:4a-hydroxytetrahydrobiopterin dehydratase [Bacteriovoracaceae bacterium]|nr:4a-hydroxytetrahydrobiopterin dehydratase [Bacteriovoracaceae bacterium]